MHNHHYLHVLLRYFHMNYIEVYLQQPQHFQHLKHNLVVLHHHLYLQHILVYILQMLLLLNLMLFVDVRNKMNHLHLHLQILLVKN